MKPEYVILTLALLLAISNAVGALFTIRRLRSPHAEVPPDSFKPPSRTSSFDDGFHIARYRTVILRVVEVGIAGSAIIVMSDFLIKSIGK